MEAPSSPALRRSKRRAAESISPLRPVLQTNVDVSASTPSKRRSKRVRFSTQSHRGSDCTNLPAGSTGLTPAISKHRLATPKTKRRVSTPAPQRSVSAPITLPPSSPIIEGELQFIPMRQVLTPRMRRRITRNHMGEQVEDFYRDKKELQRLRKEIESKDAELKALKLQSSNSEQQVRPSKSLSPIRETEEADADVNDRINDIQAELDLLRRSFQEFEEVENSNLSDDNAEGIFGDSDDWNEIPHNLPTAPVSESGDTIRIFEDEASSQYPSTTRLSDNSDVHDATSMGLELASARQAKRNFLQSSFTRRSLDASDLHFADSPGKPTAYASSPMPKITGDILTNVSRQLKAANARAEDAELALQALEGEVRSLASGFTNDDSAMLSLQALADQFRHARLELERLLPGDIAISLNATHLLLPELTKKVKEVLTELSQRTLELQNLRTQERSLRGNFEQTAATCHAAQKKADELEKSLDALNETLLNERMRANRAENERNELDRDNTTLRSSLDSYRAEVTRLESLIETMEAEHQIALKDMRSTNSNTIMELEAKAVAETTGRRAAEESAISRLRKIQDLEEKLQHAKEHAGKVETALQQDIAGLSYRIQNSATALANAEQETERLRKLLKKCEKKYRDEVFRGEEAVNRMKDEVMKAASRVMASSKGYRRASKVSFANWELESDDVQMDENGLPMTPSSTVRFSDFSEVCDLGGSDDEAEMDQENDGEHEIEESDEEHVPGSVETARGKKKSVPLTPQMTVELPRKGRRKYDSGIGIDDTLDEGDFDIDDSGLATPAFSSEADIEMEAQPQPAF